MRIWITIGLTLWKLTTKGQETATQVPVGAGWSANSVNTVIFRKNALFTHQHHQYIAYYNAECELVVGKRHADSSKWTLQVTEFTGNCSDAHNAISLIVDGDGYIHVSWDHHNSPLRYIRSSAPGALQFTQEQAMTGHEERSVSYPEFYLLPDGDVLLLYRDGGSGRGNLIINRYLLATRQWERVQTNLIDGEGDRNAYWQATVGPKGTLHLSWVWRESPDVASNHDLCYAQSSDGGISWVKSDGTSYDLPIRLATAETIQYIPENSELINQTSMTTDNQGHPWIVSYWRNAPDEVPQYQLLHFDGKWHHQTLPLLREYFSLSGVGTKAIPISRPQLVLDTKNAHLIFRAEERGNQVSTATAPIDLLQSWTVNDWTGSGYQGWEPTLDPALWLRRNRLDLFIQQTHQVDGEGMSTQNGALVEVLQIQFPDQSTNR